jgi:hypothetical protein
MRLTNWHSEFAFIQPWQRGCSSVQPEHFIFRRRHRWHWHTVSITHRDGRERCKGRRRDWGWEEIQQRRCVVAVLRPPWAAALANMPSWDPSRSPRQHPDCQNSGPSDSRNTPKSARDSQNVAGRTRDSSEAEEMRGRQQRLLSASGH